MSGFGEEPVDGFSEERRRMVRDQISRRGLHDIRLLATLSEVPRHLFVPRASLLAAYEDCPLPIGFGQTISQPYIVALMTSLLELGSDECVLEVGTGSGYQAAILGRLTREVHTVELVPQLAVAAEERLKQLEYTNVFVHLGDGSLGWPAAAPYAGIIVAAAAPGVPTPLLEQLADGGRLVIPVEKGEGYQLLKVETRRGNDTLEETITSVAFVPLRGQYGRRVS
jgi:protein-L-isoaspartate(D-aspartate) O-methyltransferase